MIRLLSFWKNIFYSLVTPIWDRVIPFFNKKTVFYLYWIFNLWGNDETRSGEGSTLRYTAPLRAALPGVLQDLQVRVFLDAPCGDYHWMRYVELPDSICYIGGDIVKPMIKRLQERYGGDRRKFVCLDVVHDPLPAANLWMCRDLIFHLPNEDVKRVLDNFVYSRIDWLLITSHALEGEGVNQEVAPGQFRCVNLLLPPFRLPAPRRKVVDFIDGYPERYLFLYHREDLRDRPWVG